MKNEVQLMILLLFGFALFPFTFVDAEKLKSGVTINASSTIETEKICDDGKDNDNDGKIDAADQDCGVTGAPTAGNCGLQIVSGTPINYGRVTIGQVSTEQTVTIKNEGNTNAKIMIKGDNWVTSTPDPEIKYTFFHDVISGPEVTHVAIAPNLDWGTKKALSSNGWELGQGLPGGQSIPVYFQLKVPDSWETSYNLIHPHQQVSIDLLC